MLKNRFLSVFALAFAAGIATPFLAENGWEAVIFIGFLLLAALFAGLYTASHFRALEVKKYLLYPVIVAVGLAVGSGWLCLRALPYETYAPYVGLSDTVKGTVTENGSSSESKYLEISVDKSLSALPEGTKVRLYGEKYQTVTVGDYVTAKLTYGSVSRVGERATGVRLVANGYVAKTEQGSGLLATLRNTLKENCLSLYDPYGVSGVAQALTLRERSLLSPETNEAYRNAGLSHLLAISGLHLSVLVAMLRKLLFAFRLRKQVREVIALLVILLYCFLTGFSPSIVRAAVMVGFVLAGELFLRETDGLTLLSIALLLLLFINPYALLSVGLQLSFLSCLGILLLEPYISELQKKLKGRGGYLCGLLAGSASLFLTSCAAVVFTFPVIAYTFGSLSWLAPLANLLFVPVFTPILTLLLLSVLVYSVIPAVGVALAFLPGQVLALMEGLFGFLAGAGIGTLQVSDGWVFLPIVLSCIAIGSMLLFRKKGALLFVCFSLASVSSLSVCALAEVLRSPAEYVILSRTESFLYVSRGEEGVLLDLGGAPSGYTLPEECFVTVYVVTEADAFSLDRLTETVSTQAIDRLYLPVSHIDGTKNDLTFFLALGEASGCETILYHRVVEEPLLTYSLAEGTAVTPYGISAVLTSAPVTLSDETVWVLSPFAELSEVEAEQVYLPFAADLTQDLPAGDLHFYHETIIYHNGEVTVP